MRHGFTRANQRIVQFSRLPPTSQRHLGSILTRIPTGIKVRGLPSIYSALRVGEILVYFKSPNPPPSRATSEYISSLQAGIKRLQYLAQCSARHLFYHVLEPHNRWTDWHHIQRMCILLFIPFENISSI